MKVFGWERRKLVLVTAVLATLAALKLMLMDYQIEGMGLLGIGVLICAAHLVIEVKGK